MKVYRVIPDSFTQGKGLNEKDYIGVEDIYYNSGYISFRGKIGKHKYNSIYRNIPIQEREEGKYFYLFPEDAVMRGYILLNSFHDLKIVNFIITEYDIPIDLILKYIGYGNYSQDITKIYTPECFIRKSDIEGINKNSELISVNEKNTNLLKSLKKSLEATIDFRNKAEYNYKLFCKLFNVNNLNTIVEDEETLKSVLLNSEYYKNFLNTNVELIETSYITGKYIVVNAIEAGGYIGWQRTEEYFKNKGLNVDYSNSQKEFKNDLLYYLGLNDTKDLDKEKIKTLLKEKTI